MPEFVKASANPRSLGRAEVVGEEEEEEEKKERVVLGERCGEPEGQAGEKEECEKKEEHEKEGDSGYEMNEDQGKEGRNVKYIYWKDD